MASNLTTSYLGDITFETLHNEIGAKLLSDVPKAPELPAKSVSPGEMLAAALASWAGSMVALYGLKNTIDMAGLTIETAFEHEDKTALTTIKLTFNMPQHAYTDKDKKVITKYVETCPVGKMLADTVKKEITINWPSA